MVIDMSGLSRTYRQQDKGQLEILCWQIEQVAMSAKIHTGNNANRHYHTLN